MVCEAAHNYKKDNYEMVLILVLMEYGLRVCVWGNKRDSQQ